MATGGVSNLLECAVCLNLMLERTPRSLTCLHTYCEECLIPLIKNNQIVCPSCRKVTNVEEGVKQLPVNFYLCQMREAGIAKNPDPQSEIIIKPERHCEICSNTLADYKCVDCPKKLCKGCKKKHASIRKYKDHAVLDMCGNHTEIAEKLCNKCKIALCASCISNHAEHAEDMITYSTALEDLENDVADMKKSLALAETEYDDSFDETILKNKSHVENLEQLKERRKYYAEKVQEADKLIEETEDNIGKFKQLEIEYEKKRFECEDLKSDIEKLYDESAKFQKLPFLKQKVQGIVHSLKQKFDEYKFPSFILVKHEPTKLAILRPPQKLQRLQKVRFLLSKACISKNMYTQISFVGEDILAIAEEEPSHVIRINQQAEVIDHYFPKEEGNITGVSSYNDKIYMLQERVVSTVEYKDQNTRQNIMNIGKFGIDSPRMSKICVVDNQNFLISDYKNPGSIYLCNILKGLAKPVVQGLNYPTYINIAYSEDGPRYIITESNAHCVRVYSDTWTLLYTIGKPGSPGSTVGEFNFPLATAVTEQNTILIADGNNKRVCHFTLDGTFLSHVLTAEDGIGLPVSILYLNSQLWLSTHGSENIKCFQLEFKE